MRAFRSSHFAWVMIVCVLAMFCLAFRTGIVRGFDHTVSTGAWGRLLYGIGAAISEKKGDVHGYVFTPSVRDALTNGGLTDDKAVLKSLGTQFPDNFANADLLNRAMDAALKSPPDHNASPIVHDDIGDIDFYKLAFDLFGPRVLSFYLTYFVISALGILTFLVALRDRPVNLALLAIVVAGELLLFVSDFYDVVGHAVGSVIDARYMSVLAVVPGLYIGLLAWERRPLSWPKGVGLAVQATILVFVYAIRASVIWIVAAIAVLIGAALLFSLVRSGRARVFTSIAAGIAIALSLAFVYSTRASSLWVMIAVAALLGAATCAALINRKSAIVVNALSAAVVLALSFAGHGVFVRHALNPIYQRMGIMTAHPLWHSAILSLSGCPAWQSKYAPIYNAQFDYLPPVVVNKYLEHHPAPANLIFHGGSYNNTPLTDFGYEVYTRLAFMDILKRDPKFVLDCVVFFRPPVFARGLVGRLATLWQPSEPAFWLAILTPLIIGVYLAGASARHRRVMTVAAVLTTAFFCLASAPNLAVDVNPYNMIDATLMLICAIGAVAAVLVGWILRFALRFRGFDRLPFAPAASASR